MKLEKVFFQSSMPRSGSTYLQNVLNNHPEVYATPTDGLLEILFGGRANLSSMEFKAQDADLMKKAFASFCKAGLEAYSNELLMQEGVADTKKYVINKSRGWGVYRGFIETFYPDPKIICMVRDLKDVVCSYEKIYRNNQHLHDPIRNDSTAEGTTLYKRVDAWMNPQNTIGRAVERLLEIKKWGYENKILFVKYEDLCLYPDTEMTRIYQYLGVPYFKHDWDNIPQTTKEDDSVYGLGSGLHVIRPKLEMKPSDAKQVLGQDITDWIYNTYKWYYDWFNYKK